MLQYGYSVNKLPQERYRYEFISRSHPLYERLTVKPLESLDNLKLALTRMWEAIDVQVDWSRPA